MKKVAYLLLALTLVACSGKKQQASLPSSNEFAVETISPQTADLNTTYPAIIKGVQDVEIRSKVSGNIVKQLVDEGDFVKAGQPLFQIDPTQYRSAVAQARAAVNVAKASIATQELTVQNKRMLRQRDIVSQFDLDVAVNQLATLRAQLGQAKAALAAATDQLSFCTIRATSSGVIGSIPYRLGTLVGPSSPEPLTVVSNLSTMYAYFSLTEKQLLEMTRTSGGSSAAVKDLPEVTLLLADGTTYEQKGKVSSLSGVLDVSTGSVKMRATFANPQSILRSGATGQISFHVHHTNAILVAQKSTYEIQNKKFVYLVGKDNKVKATEIEVLPQNDGQTYVVTKGLNVGDRIVVEGVNKLSNDMEIKPITPQQSEAQQKKSQQHMAEKKMPGQ